MDFGLQTALTVICGLAALGWIAQVATTTIVLARVRAREDHADAVLRAARLARRSKYIAVPLALVVAATGAYVVHRSASISLAGDWWIGTAFGAWLVAFFGSTIGRGMQLSLAARMSTTAEDGPADEEVRWRIRNVDLVTRGELVLLCVALVVVALQPGPDAFG